MKKRHGLAIFLLAMVVALAGCIVLVRNRQAAASMAKAIVLADQAGTNVETDILKLKAYGASHMKVNVQFTLTGSYDRAVAAAKAEAAKSSGTYAAAQQSCDRRGVDSIRQSQCVAAYLAANGGSQPQVQLPDKKPYQYAIVGPAWSFDIAGLLFIISIGLAVFAVVSVVHRVVTK